MIIEEPALDEGIAQLRRLQGLFKSANCRSEVGETSLIGASTIATRYRLLLESGYGRIVGAQLGGELVSAALFTCLNGLVLLYNSRAQRRSLEDPGQHSCFGK